MLKRIGEAEGFWDPEVTIQTESRRIEHPLRSDSGLASKPLSTTLSRLFCFTLP